MAEDLGQLDVEGHLHEDRAWATAEGDLVGVVDDVDRGVGALDEPRSLGDWAKHVDGVFVTLVVHLLHAALAIEVRRTRTRDEQHCRRVVHGRGDGTRGVH